MAQLFPAGWNAPIVTAGAQREVETLEVLQRELPETYTVYHGVHWTQLNKGFSIFGEADFVVVSPAGRVLVIEQKAGALEETPDGLVKAYSGQKKSVRAQIARTISGLHGRFTDAFGARSYRLEELLYCPDYRVKEPDISGVNPLRIVDAVRRADLVPIIESILPADEQALPCLSRIHEFLADQLSLTPDVRAMIGDVSRFVTRVSGGLATWARSIEFEPFRLRVIGTAGSGKTQLAMRLLDDAQRAGKRALYLCYNRPLADHLRGIAPANSTVLTYHQLCQAVAQRTGATPDFGDPRVFEALEHVMLNATADQLERFDTVIVDEGQDFRQEWVEPISRLLNSNGRFWWLEDPMQNLYMRTSVVLPGWVQVRAASNYRSPHDVVRLIGMLATTKVNVEAAGPFADSDVRFVTYADGGVEGATNEALKQASAAGFRLEDIALLTFHGRDKSAFTASGCIGQHALHRFSGAYDTEGTPVYQQGDVLFESIYRFKGQSAPCVILTEVDFERFDEAVFRRFFVGATRATMKLIVVISERAAAKIVERMG